MFREEAVWYEIKNILSSAPQLSYIKKVYEGWRENVPQDGFPCIYLEPASTDEEGMSFAVKRNIKFNVKIIAEMLCHDFDKQIVGDDNIKGIIDIANDIKSVLWATPNLNGKCIQFNFTNTIYEFKNFPFRHCEINMQIQMAVLGNTR